MDSFDDDFQGRPFFSQCLGPVRIIPDQGLFQFAINLDQAFRLSIVVKDTS
jgi:hypothetical protein